MLCSAAPTLRRVRGAEHAPLRGVQRPGARHLAGLLKLRAHAGHHAQRGDERQPRQHLRRWWGRAQRLALCHAPIPGETVCQWHATKQVQCDLVCKQLLATAHCTPHAATAHHIIHCPYVTCSSSPHLRDSLALHAEALDGPVAAADGALQTVRDGVGADALGDVKLAGAVGLRGVGVGVGVGGGGSISRAGAGWQALAGCTQQAGHVTVVSLTTIVCLAPLGGLRAIQPG